MSKSLAKEIQMKRAKISGDPAFYLARSQRIIHALDSSMKIYSWWIEHPQIRANVLDVTDRKERGKLIKRARDGIKNLGIAWRYLHSQKDFLNRFILKETGAKVEPNLNRKGFRDGRVSLVLVDYIPPNNARIDELLDGALVEARYNNQKSIIERVATLHLRIAGIQPFNEGNKRVARLYQDRLLYDADLPLQ